MSLRLFYVVVLLSTKIGMTRWILSTVHGESIEGTDRQVNMCSWDLKAQRSAYIRGCRKQRALLISVSGLSWQLQFFSDVWKLETRNPMSLHSPESFLPRLKLGRSSSAKDSVEEAPEQKRPRLAEAQE